MKRVSWNSLANVCTKAEKSFVQLAIHKAHFLHKMKRNNITARCTKAKNVFAKIWEKFIETTSQNRQFDANCKEKRKNSPDFYDQNILKTSTKLQKKWRSLDNFATCVSIDEVRISFPKFLSIVSIKSSLKKYGIASAIPTNTQSESGSTWLNYHIASKATKFEANGLVKCTTKKTRVGGNTQVFASSNIYSFLTKSHKKLYKNLNFNFDCFLWRTLTFSLSRQNLTYTRCKDTSIYL